MSGMSFIDAEKYFLGLQRSQTFAGSFNSGRRKRPSKNSARRHLLHRYLAERTGLGVNTASPLSGCLIGNTKLKERTTEQIGPVYTKKGDTQDPESENETETNVQAGVHGLDDNHCYTKDTQEKCADTEGDETRRDKTVNHPVTSNQNDCRLEAKDGVDFKTGFQANVGKVPFVEDRRPVSSFPVLENTYGVGTPGPSSTRSPCQKMATLQYIRKENEFLKIGHGKRKERLHSKSDSDETVTSPRPKQYKKNETRENEKTHTHRDSDRTHRDKEKHTYLNKEKLAQNKNNVHDLTQKVVGWLQDTTTEKRIKNRSENEETDKDTKEKSRKISEKTQRLRKKLTELKLNDDNPDLSRSFRRNKSERFLSTLDRVMRRLKIAVLIRRGFTGRMKYYTEDVYEEPGKEGSSKFKEVLGDITHTRSSIGWETQMCLRTQPHRRTDEQIRRIVCLLRATKAFKHFFPDDVETELARYLAYEIYDDGRLLAYQGRTPERLYYIISGTINELKQFDLTAGEVTKTVGCYTKGMTTDLLQLKNQCIRETNLIAKGQVEVFILYHEDFFDLMRTAAGPPLDWIQSLDLFKEFPCDLFKDNSEVIDYNYYPQNEIVTHDSNESPWIHIVKWGTVKVVRGQDLVDVKGDQIFSAPTVDELGCGKAFSHADDMLGILVKQKNIKTYTHVVLPKVPLSRALIHSSHETLDSDSNKMSEASNTDSVCKIISEEKEDDLEYKTTCQDNDKEVEKSQLTLFQKQKSKRELTFLPPLGVPLRDPDAPMPLFLTKERTQVDALFTPRKKKQEEVLRPAYMHLDTLKPGEIFGLEHMEKKTRIRAKTKGVCLVSAGSEVIRISKVFFMENANNNTVMKVETMLRKYMSEEEIKEIMKKRETWKQYKTVLMKRYAENPRPKPSQNIR